MPRRQAGYYVYVIYEPGTRNIVFVGNGPRPWESIQRHMHDSTNPKMREWAKKMLEKYDNKLQIVGEEVCWAWEGEPKPFPALPPGWTRLEWEIIDFEDDPEGDSPGSVPAAVPPTKKAKWIRKFREEGHPLLNESPGRPRHEKREKAEA